MLEQSKEYLAAVKSPQRQVDAKFTLNNRVCTGTKLAKLDYDQAIVSGTSYTFGGAYVAGLNVEIKELVEGIQEMMPATAEIGISVNGAMEYKPIGQFFVTDIELDRNTNSTKLKLQDGFCKLNGEYQSRLSYPTTARAVFSEICQICNISTMPMNIPDTIILGTKLEKTSYREAIQYIAQLVGSYAIFNRKGQLEFRNIQKLSYRVNRDNYVMGGFKRKEIKFRLHGVECELASNQKISVGSANGNVVKIKNPWMTQMYLDELFSKVQGFQFYPYSLNFQGDPCLEVGDWIEVEFSKGEYFQAPILVEKLYFDGGLHSEIAANTLGVSDVVYQYKSPLARKVEYLEGRISADGLSQVYSGLDEPNPAHLKKGDTWFRPNGTDIDILMWDGNRWVVHNSREKFDELKREFEDQEKYFDELKKKFEEQDKYFKELDAEFETSKQILDSAKADLDNAKLELEANKQSIKDNEKLIQQSSDELSGMREKFNQVDNTLESQQGLFEEFGNELRNNISLAEELDRKSSSFESNLLKVQSNTKDLMDSYRGIYDKTRDLENIFENLSYSGENYFSRLGLSNCSPNKGVAFDSVTNEVTLGKYGTHSFTQFYNMLKPMKDFVGKHVMLSFDAISPNGTAKIRPYNNVSHAKYVMQPLLLNDNNIVDNEWKHFDYKINVVETNDTNELESNKILFFANDQNGVKIRNVDFYIGDKPRDYRAPTLDLEILTRGKITDVEHRLVEEDNKIRNYFTGQIQSLNGDISTAKTAITQELNRYKVEMAEKNNNQDIKYSSLEQTAEGIRSEVTKKITAVDGRVTTLNNAVTQTANSWAVQNIKNSNDIVSQINLTDDNVYIKGKNIWLDGTTHIEDAVIKNAHIGDAQITNTKIGNAAITSAKIQDASITNAKIADAAIANAKIANATITGAKIARATITNANIASATIGTAEIKDAAIINAKIANGAITSAKIGNAQILGAHIQDATITNAKIVNLDASKITTGTMSADRIYGGIINAKNGAMRIDLNSSNIEFNYSSSINFKSGSNAIKRIRNGCTGFLHFNDDAYGGIYVGLGVTSSNEGLNSQNTSRFAGVRIFRPNDKVDKVEMYGDEITFSHAFNSNAHALIIDPLKFSRNFTMSEIINSISSLWRCWQHLNNVYWDTKNNDFGKAVFNELNAHGL